MEKQQTEQSQGLQMCDCIKKVEDEIEKREHDGRQIDDAEISQMMVIRHNSLLSTVAIPVKLQLHGLQRHKTTHIAASYCPFCGQKYPKLS